MPKIYCYPLIMLVTRSTNLKHYIITGIIINYLPNHLGDIGKMPRIVCQIVSTVYLPCLPPLFALPPYLRCTLNGKHPTVNNMLRLSLPCFHCKIKVAFRPKRIIDIRIVGALIGVKTAWL